MNPKRAGGAIIIFFALIALIWLVLTFIAPGDALAPHLEGEAAASEDRLTVYHTQAADVHTYRTEIETPTPCHSVSTAVNIEYGTPTHASIDIQTAPAADGLCAHVVTKQPVEVSVMTVDVPTVSISINGAAQAITLIEN